MKANLHSNHVHHLTFAVRNVFVFLVGMASVVSGQVSEGGTPPSFSRNIPDILQTVTTPLVDAAALLSEDELQAGQDLPFRFGKGFDVGYGIHNSGSWTTLPDGGTIWRLRIESPGAYSINLIYSEFWLPPGAKFFIYSEDRSMIIGAFTEANNKEHSQFATGLVKGPVSILEYHEPPAVAGEGKITISRIVHGYRNMFDRSTASEVLGKILDFGDSGVGRILGFGDSGDCNNNVYCGDGLDWIDQIRSVGMIVTSGGTRICSGALVNNTAQNETPYFLTANHCYDGGYSTWIVYLNYEADACTDPGSDPGLTLSVSGTTLRARWSSSDFMLLQLSQSPPDYYQVYYAGWSRSTTAPNDVVGIHHPLGDIKKSLMMMKPLQPIQHIFSMLRHGMMVQ